MSAPQAPLAADGVYFGGEASAVKYDWKIEAARVALESGLSATAADIYQSLFENADFTERERAEISLDYVAALISQGKYKEASNVLSSSPILYDANRRSLYQASIIYGREPSSNSMIIEAELAGIDPEALSDLDLPWFYLLKGILADSEGDLSKAGNYFHSAEESASSFMQSALFSSLIMRQEILKSQTDEKLLVEIREKFEALSGKPAAFPFLLEYVVLLHGTGKDAEAISVLEGEIAQVSAGYSMEERADLLLLKGLILGLNSNAGWSAMKELVRLGIDTEASVIALQLLGSVSERESELMAFLTEIISRPDPHPLIAQLYYMRCQLALANPETIELAAEDARYLLEQFPGFSEITSVYRLLAYAALRRQPPRHRVAADYLLELRERLSDSAEITQVNRLIGDCYFLNRDYANAADFYESAISATETDSGSPDAFLRLAISQIRSGEFEEALANLDQSTFTGQMGEADRWRAEWSIALALQANGQAERALDRLRTLIDQDTVSVPALLDLRLRWLEAYISLQLGDDFGVADKLDVLLARIDAMPGDALNPEEISRLKSEILLLKTKSMLALGETEAAFEVIAKIRADFKSNVAAQRSYFVEAAYYASINDFRSAKGILTSFAADYPKSGLVAQALFEAALHCQRQGPDHYGEAVVLLDRLVQEHPESDLVYYAGLKQGDLLRLMNNFAGAQLIYENLINRFPAHRLSYASELSRADCIAALAKDEGGRLAEALSILERLLDQPDLPVEAQIEAGYKWGRILVRNNNPGEARTVFGLVAGRFLLDSPNAAKLTSVGSYWLSRTIFSLGDLLENEEKFNEAEKLYRKLVAFNLPGRSLALSRISQLQLAESP